MERQQFTIDVASGAVEERFFDAEMTRSARRVVPLVPASRQTWKIYLVAGGALLCGALGGLALGLNQGYRAAAPEVFPTPVSAREASLELLALPVAPPDEAKETVSVTALPAAPSPLTRPVGAAKAPRLPPANAKTAAPEPAALVTTVAPPEPALNNGLTRPRRAAKPEANNFPKRPDGVATVSTRLSLAEPKPQLRAPRGKMR